MSHVLSYLFYCLCVFCVRFFHDPTRRLECLEPLSHSPKAQTLNTGAGKVQYGCGNTPDNTQMPVKSVASSKPIWLPANHPKSPAHVHLRALIGWRCELIMNSSSQILRHPLLNGFSFLRQGEVKVTLTGRALPFVRTGPRAKQIQSIDHHVEKALTEHHAFQSTSTGRGDAVLLTAMTGGMKGRGKRAVTEEKAYSESHH